MSEIYSAKERWIIFMVLLCASMLVSLVYTFLRVDRRQISIIIFIICLIYATAFVYLNLLAVFDLTFTSEEGYEKLLKLISVYYKVFTWIDKALGFVIFNLLIYYLESGHFEIYKRILDGFIRTYNEIKDMIKCPNIIKLIIFSILGLFLLIVLIVYRKHFGLGNNPFDYLEVILDCYSIFEIYACVGFFIYQLIKDHKMRKDKKLMNRYYNYTLMKIVEKIDKFFGKIKNTYEILNKAVMSLPNNRDSYHIFLEENLNDVKQKMKLFGIDDINPNFNNNLNNNPNNNLNSNQDSYRNMVNNNIGIRDKPAQEVEIKEKEEKKDEDVPTCIRKYKKSIRKITRLKKLYQETMKDKDELKRGIPKRCGWAYKLLFVPFAVAILTDFILPFALDGNSLTKDEKEPEIEHQKEESHLNLAVEVLLSVPIAGILCSYTIITVYSTTRRQYISGDFLYDKQISDNLSLLKTVQIVCGYSFALVYCNMYFWRSMDVDGTYYGQPGFYGETIVPDYNIKHGLSVYMIIKIILIIATIIITLYFSNFFVFKNDLAGYNLNGDVCIYDNENTLHYFLQKKYNIVSFLSS